MAKRDFNSRPSTDTPNETIEDIVGQDNGYEVKDTAKEKPAVSKNARGIIYGCALLNVRATPSIDGIVKSTIKERTKVSIDESKSTKEFYCIKTEDGLTGFCMSKYVKVY